MSLHTELPIYKKGCDLLSLAFDVQRQMPRDFKRSIGEKIHSHCVEMLNSMALANATRRAERTAHIEELLKRLHVTTVLLRVSFDKRIVSKKLWADATQMLDSIGKQAGGWLKSARDNKAPAA
jgi:hypothetical protein